MFSWKIMFIVDGLYNTTLLVILKHAISIQRELRPRFIDTDITADWRLTGTVSWSVTLHIINITWMLNDSLKNWNCPYGSAESYSAKEIFFDLHINKLMHFDLALKPLLSAAERRGTPVLLSALVSDNFGNSPQIAAPRRSREIDQSTQRFYVGWFHVSWQGIGDQSDAVTQNSWFRCAICAAISGEISILIQTGAESWGRFPVPRICRWESLKH